MEMTRPCKSASSDTVAGIASVDRIDRGRAIVVAASDCHAPIVLRGGGEVWRVAIPAGAHALVCAGSIAISMEGAVAAGTVPASVLSRWMAFRDAAFDAAPVAEVPRHPLVIPGCKEMRDPLELCAFLVELLRRDPQLHERLRTHVAAGEHYQIARYVLGQAPSARVGDLAASYGLSATHFRLRCGEVFGRSAKDQLRQLRASHALLSYQGSETLLSDLALDAGYASQSHFSDEIKEFVGLSPRHIYKAVHQ
ncbi:helix-turn-helix domain-containing protein [Stenotrophomonas maltophilia]|nr:helix-turn-helix domain-containing protein [Stenotrophomonas maltophilia]